MKISPTLFAVLESAFLLSLRDFDLSKSWQSTLESTFEKVDSSSSCSVGFVISVLLWDSRIFELETAFFKPRKEDKTSGLSRELGDEIAASSQKAESLTDSPPPYEFWQSLVAHHRHTRHKTRAKVCLYALPITPSFVDLPGRKPRGCGFLPEDRVRDFAR